MDPTIFSCNLKRKVKKNYGISNVHKYLFPGGFFIVLYFPGDFGEFLRKQLFHYFARKEGGS
jgi:hypothetical protein